MTTESAEVIVVGGGPAGAASAMHLQRQGHQVVLLERAHLPRPKPCGESLSPEATPLLARLGVLKTLSEGAHGTLKGFQIYPYARPPFRGAYTGRANGISMRSTGFSIKRTRLDTVLLDAARDCGVEVREGWTAQNVTAWDGTARIVRGVDSTGAGFAVQTQLLIAADGVHSTMTRRLGLARPSARLRQLAIVTHMRGVAGTTAFGEMHVTHNAYCGVAPLGNDEANVAIVAPASEVRARLRHEGGVLPYFLAHLASYPHLTSRLRDAEVIAGPWVTSGLAQGVRRRVDDGVLLVGDAAGYYDPFTGEGIYRGLRAAEIAAMVGGEALGASDTGAASLRRYSAMFARQFVPKRLVEVIVHEVTTRQRLFEHVADRMRARPRLADTLIGVTGDFISPYEVLNPWYLARLFI